MWAKWMEPVEPFRRLYFGDHSKWRMKRFRGVDEE